MTTKKVFSASDAHPTVLHAKREADSEIAYPIIVDAFGNLLVASGGSPTGWDYISLTPPAQPTTVTFKQGGSGGTTMSTFTLTYSNGSVSTIAKS